MGETKWTPLRVSPADGHPTRDGIQTVRGGAWVGSAAKEYATLFAAAPDLYEALRRAESALRFFHGTEDWTSDEDKVLAAASAALAKARGATP